MAPAAFEKRVLRRADCHDGPRAHTRPCDTFGSLRFHRLGPPRWWGELRSAEGPGLTSSLPSCPSNKETRSPAVVNQYCAPLRGLLGLSLPGCLALTVCSGLRSGDTGHSGGGQRGPDVLTLTVAFKVLAEE